MDRHKADAALRGPPHPLFDGLADVEHLRIEEDPVLCSKRHHNSI
jgi:hypothetical protein